MTLSLQFVSGATYLTADNKNYYYKVPVPWGINLFEGIVSVVCRSAVMKPVCHYSGSTDPALQKLNVDGCLKMEADDRAMINIAALLNVENSDCNGNEEGVLKCEPLYGLFNAEHSLNDGECGVTETEYCAKGNYFRSAVNYVSKQESQFYALCGISKRGRRLGRR